MSVQVRAGTVTEASVRGHGEPQLRTLIGCRPGPDRPRGRR
ncbi:hypothetical protein [Streptomyces sp. CB02923]|nr:hypothetical protein [Streptomyces sp. CB02923]